MEKAGEIVQITNRAALDAHVARWQASQRSRS